MKDLVALANAMVVDLCQLLAIVVITIGTVKAMWIFVKDALLGSNSSAAIQESRMELGHSFSLGLGFLIGASILKTTLAPTWNDIGQLAAIIALRTVLNHFLLRDIRIHKPAETPNGKTEAAAPGVSPSAACTCGQKDTPSPEA